MSYFRGFARGMRLDVLHQCRNADDALSGSCPRTHGRADVAMSQDASSRAKISELDTSNSRSIVSNARAIGRLPSRRRRPANVLGPPSESNPSSLARLNTGTTTPRIPVRPSNSGTRLGTGTIFSLFTASPEISRTRNAKGSPSDGDREHRLQLREPAQAAATANDSSKRRRISAILPSSFGTAIFMPVLCTPATLCGTFPPEHRG